MKFKIGDRVKVIDRNSKLRGAVGTVVQIYLPTIVVEIDTMKHSSPVAFSMNDLMRIGKITYKSDDNKTIIVAAGHNIRIKDYTKPNTLKGETEMKFKIGDRVQMVNPSSRLYKAIGTVVEVAGSFVYICFNYNNYDDKSATKYGPYMASDFKLISKDNIYKAQTEAMMAAAGYSDTDQDGDTMFKIPLNSIYGLMSDYGIGGLTQMFNKNSIPEIRNVYFNDPLTCVIWKDGTKTFVKNADGDHNYDPEKALAMAISKKALGNMYNYYKEFEKWLPKEDAKFSVKSLLEASKELSKSLASFEATTKENKAKLLKMALTKNPVEKAYLALLKVNDDPTSKDADFAAAIEEAIGYLGEALDD
jgi:hypothetical protein